MLERIDGVVGQVMKTLEENGLAENTLFVFFSDNGGAGKVGNNGHLRSGKTWLYEGGIREPLLISWPGKIKEGVVSDRSEEHTSELQSLMRISYAVFCLKKKTHQIQHT